MPPKVEKASKKSFNLNEKVWACDKGNYYLAKILRQWQPEKSSSKKTISNKYFIHYDKWAPKHDVWLDESLIEPFGDGINPSKRPVEAAVAESKESTQNDTTDTTATSSSGVKRKHGVNIELNDENDIATKEALEQIKNKPVSKHKLKQQKLALATSDLMIDEEEETFTIQFNIPANLKQHLVDEWTVISAENNKRFVKLPRPRNLTLSAILHAYLADKCSNLETVQVRVTRYICSFI